jgi:ATP-dependent protease ClpP protease subunit
MINEGAEKVTILFASDGGSTDDGIALHTYLTALPMEITMHAVGTVPSIAIPVFLSTPKRLASKHASFFFHEFTWTHPQATTLTQSTMAEQIILLNAAMVWTKEVVKATMKLFDHPVLIAGAAASEHGIVTSITEPSILAGSQPRIVM